MLWEQDDKKYTMMTILLLVAGCACFLFFFKTVDFFEKV